MKNIYFGLTFSQPKLHCTPVDCRDFKNLIIIIFRPFTGPFTIYKINMPIMFLCRSVLKLVLTKLVQLTLTILQSKIIATGDKIFCVFHVNNGTCHTTKGDICLQKPSVNIKNLLSVALLSETVFYFTSSIFRQKTDMTTYLQ